MFSYERVEKSKSIKVLKSVKYKSIKSLVPREV